MVVRVNNIGGWRQLMPGNALALEGAERRLIRITVNCAYPTVFHCREDSAEKADLTFLGVVQGLETLEFRAGPDVYVVATPGDPEGVGEVWYRMLDGEVVGEDLNQKSFATLAVRAARNPEQEWAMFMMKQNQLRMEELQREQRMRMEAEFAEFKARLAEAAGADPVTGEVHDADDQGATGGDGGGSEPVARASSKSSKAKVVPADDKA